MPAGGLATSHMCRALRLMATATVLVACSERRYDGKTEAEWVGMFREGSALDRTWAVGALAEIPVRLVIVSDEEVGSPEGRPLLQRELAGAACALVFEAGREGDRIITARRGTGNAVVRAMLVEPLRRS